MADRQLVLSFFPDELAADNAAVALKDSGIADGDAIGILALDSDGKLKQDKVGARSTGKGAAIGGVLAPRPRTARAPMPTSRPNSKSTCSRPHARATARDTGAKRRRQGPR